MRDDRPTGYRDVSNSSVSLWTITTVNILCDSTSSTAAVDWGHPANVWRNTPNCSGHMSSSTFDCDPGTRWRRRLRDIEEAAMTAERARTLRRDGEMAAERRRLRVEANERAETLLISCLTPEQRESFRKNGYFTVAGSKGGIYQIHRGRLHNIYRLDLQGNKVEEICCAPRMQVPDCDTMLSQKLTLEVDEDELRRKANIWHLPSRRMLHRAPEQITA